MKNLLRAIVGFLVAVLLIGPFVDRVSAFKYTGARWPSTTTTMYIAVGSPWDGAFINAMSLWNSATVFQFAHVAQFWDPCANPNTPPIRNGVKFSNTLCGDDFGSSTLAVTSTWTQGSTAVQSGIVFNSKWSWAVYDGPWSTGTNAGKTDFQRVAVHELGHVMGLEHEDSASAIMSTAVGPGNTITAPQPDDISGVNGLYGNATSDTQSPVLTITSHTNNQSVTTSNVTISGTATDSGQGDNGISSVTVNGARAGNDTATGAGTANWSRVVALSPGTNTITVVARDVTPALNSTTLSITLVYTPQTTSVTAGTYHIFPQFADGRFADGTGYRTTLMISNSSSSSTTCTLQLRSGLTVPGFATSYTIAPGRFVIAPTSGTQTFKSGYATLQCSGIVEAQLLYSYYASNGVKISEATVFSSPPANSFGLSSDERDGARFGIAIANDTDSSITYTISVAASGFNGQRQVTLNDRTSTASFLNELVTGMPANTTSAVTVMAGQSTDTGSVIGLRYTGGIFTTMPANPVSGIGPTVNAYHAFPQFADGRFSDGTYYRTARMYLNPNSNSSADCTTRLRGLTTDGNNIFTLTLPALTFFNGRTNGTQTFQSGYATVQCSVSVYAQAVYSFYSPAGLKLSEATVFSSPPANQLQVLVDARESARLGIAIANDSDQSATYNIVVTDANGATVGSTSRTLSARASVADFLDNFVTLSPNFVGAVVVSAPTGRTVSVIGLRFTGTAFTTIPATVR